MATSFSAPRSEWLLKLPTMGNSQSMHVYPREGLSVADAEAAIKVSGKDFDKIFRVRTHGSALIIDRCHEWYEKKIQGAQ